MHTRWARFTRGWLAAGVATVTAAASHTFAGAEAPAPAVLALALAFSGMLCVLLAGRTLSLVRLSTSVLLSQIAYHLLFLLSPGGTAVSASGGAEAAHLHGAAGPVVLTVGDSAALHAGHGTGMYVAHALAALLTVVALRVGERSFWGAGRLVLRVVVRLVAAAALPAPLARPVALRRADRVAVPHSLDTVLSVLRHRGPPRGRVSASFVAA